MYMIECPRCGRQMPSNLPLSYMTCACGYQGAPMIINTPVPPSLVNLSKLSDEISLSPVDQAILDVSLVAAQIRLALAHLAPSEFDKPMIDLCDGRQNRIDQLSTVRGQRRMGDFPPSPHDVLEALRVLGAPYKVLYEAAKKLNEG